MKTIFRTNPQKEFTILANRMLRDRTLSFKARGMLAMIMTHSETWEVHASWISEQGTEGREAISSGLTELEAAGYVQYQQVKDEGTGQFTGGMWTFSDRPSPDNQRTNKTRWREKYEAAQASQSVEKAHGNRGLAPVTTGSRTTAETTGSRETGSQHTASPRDGNPSAKKDQGDQKDNLQNKIPAVAAEGDVLMHESPGDVMGWREIGLALLEAFGRPSFDIDRLGCEEHHNLVLVDKQCTREELVSLVRFIKKPLDSNHPLLKSRAQKMSKLLPAFREQIGLALRVCPPPRTKPVAGDGKVATTVVPPPELTEEQQAEKKKQHDHRMSLLRIKLRGGPGAKEAAAELDALEAAMQAPAMAS